MMDFERKEKMAEGEGFESLRGEAAAAGVDLRAFSAGARGRSECPRPYCVAVSIQFTPSGRH